MTDALLITLLLGAATFSIRFLGVVLGQHIPTSGRWTRALNALPGCLIVSLVTLLLVRGGPNEWIAGFAALCVAYWSRSLPLTMLIGIGVLWGLRNLF